MIKIDLVEANEQGGNTVYLVSECASKKEAALNAANFVNAFNGSSRDQMILKMENLEVPLRPGDTGRDVYQRILVSYLYGKVNTGRSEKKSIDYRAMEYDNVKDFTPRRLTAKEWVLHYDQLIDFALQKRDDEWAYALLQKKNHRKGNKR